MSRAVAFTVSPALQTTGRFQGFGPDDVLYLLQRRSGGPKIFGFIAGDELAAFREHFTHRDGTIVAEVRLPESAPDYAALIRNAIAAAGNGSASSGPRLWTSSITPWASCESVRDAIAAST